MWLTSLIDCLQSSNRGKVGGHVGVVYMLFLKGQRQRIRDRALWGKLGGPTLLSWKARDNRPLTPIPPQHASLSPLHCPSAASSEVRPCWNKIPDFPTQASPCWSGGDGGGQARLQKNCPGDLGLKRCFKGPHTGLTMLKWYQSSHKLPGVRNLLQFWFFWFCFVLCFPIVFLFPPIVFVVLGEVRRPFEGKFSFTYNRKVTEKF